MKIINKNKYVRTCPSCNNEIYYKWTSDYYTARKKKSKCKKCSSNNTQFKKNHKLNEIYTIRKNTLNDLLNENNTTFYWLGFLIADGFFNNNKFELTLSKKDENHLNKFANYINFNGTIKYKYNSCRLLFNNKESIKNIFNKYGNLKNKTYNPLNFNIFNNYSRDMIISLFIGIIDGDGYIGNNGSKNSFRISISAHENWKEFYQHLNKKINIPFYIGKNKNKNTIYINLYKKEYINELYYHIIQYNLPILNRKWDKINIMKIN